METAWKSIRKGLVADLKRMVAESIEHRACAEDNKKKGVTYARSILRALLEHKKLIVA